eukprot:4987792-Pleurochrysis_carterae.AAC.3
MPRAGDFGNTETQLLDTEYSNQACTRVSHDTPRQNSGLRDDMWDMHLSVARLDLAYGRTDCCGQNAQRSRVGITVRALRSAKP